MKKEYSFQQIVLEPGYLYGVGRILNSLHDQKKKNQHYDFKWILDLKR